MEDLHYLGIHSDSHLSLALSLLISLMNHLLYPVSELLSEDGVDDIA